MFWNLQRSPLMADDPGTPAGGGDPNPNPGAATFDPAAFKTEMLGEFNKTINGFAKSFQKDISKLIQPLLKPVDPPSDPDPATPPDPGAKPIDPAVNAELQRQKRELDALKREREQERAELAKERSQRLETERRSLIENALSDIQFRDSASKNLFFKAVNGDIKRDEDGNLIAETEAGPLPYKDYIKQQAEQLPHLLAGKGSGGAGATSGRGSARKVFNIETMTPADIAALSPADRAEFTSQLSSVIQGRQ